MEIEIVKCIVEDERFMESRLGMPRLIFFDGGSEMYELYDFYEKGNKWVEIWKPVQGVIKPVQGVINL